MRVRFIPIIYPHKILTQPDDQYFDPLTRHQVAVKKLKYNGKLRPMVTVYDIIGGEIQAITIYPTTDQEINNRVKNGRWIKYKQSLKIFKDKIYEKN